MRLRCNMRFTFDGETVHEVGEVIEREYEEVKNAIRDRALTPLPDLTPVSTVNVAEVADAMSKTPRVSSDTSEVKED